MHIHQRHLFSRRLLLNGAGILIALLLAASVTLLLLPKVSHRVFAASTTTCAHAPSMEHCNQQDPELQGCAADAATLAQADIMENGVTIGRVERRWSATCQSWWGRVFDTQPDAKQNLSVAIAGTTISAAPTFVSDQYRILYSPMVFDATPTQEVPQITGELFIGNTAAVGIATLPIIMVPGK